MIIALLSSTFWLRGEFKPFSFFKLFVFIYILGYTCIQNSFHNLGGPCFSYHNILNLNGLFLWAGAPMIGMKRLSGCVFINILAYPSVSPVFQPPACGKAPCWCPSGGGF